MPSLTPCLWFEDELDAAIAHYSAVFPSADISSVQRPSPDAPALSATFVLAGQKFMALNGRRDGDFSDSVSFFLGCADQAEVDHYWENLASGGGTELQCGWLRDRFGVTWQVVPTALFDFMNGPDKAGAERAMKAILGMKRLVIAEIEAAYLGSEVPEEPADQPVDRERSDAMSGPDAQIDPDRTA
ncbi:VOC family protein [Pelagibacterium montanilacus]|uniref:VOC family protein n=1 Tax=Pelagibacterium montanilacus TaxID=2185280 RepID=UPI000F8E7C5F|nr:VOC family protein [Pelagibacterium montanilacus]